VLLLDAVARLREIENYGDEHAETAEVFKGFEKRPVAEDVGHPFPEHSKAHKGMVTGFELLAAAAPVSGRFLWRRTRIA